MDHERRTIERLAHSDLANAMIRRSNKRASLKAGRDEAPTRLNATSMAVSEEGLLLVATRGNLEWRTSKGALLEDWPAPPGYGNCPRKLALRGRQIAVTNWGCSLAILDRSGTKKQEFDFGDHGLSQSQAHPDSRLRDPVRAIQFESNQCILVLCKNGLIYRIHIPSGRKEKLGFVDFPFEEECYDLLISTRRAVLWTLNNLKSNIGFGSISVYCWKKNIRRALILPQTGKPWDLTRESALRNSSTFAASLSPDQETLVFSNKAGFSSQITLPKNIEEKVTDYQFLDPLAPWNPLILEGPTRNVVLAHDHNGETIYGINTQGDLIAYCQRTGERQFTLHQSFVPGYPHNEQYWHPILGALKSSSHGHSVHVTYATLSALEAGDRLISLNETPVLGLFDWIQRLKEAPRKSKIQLERDGKQRSVAVLLEKSDSVEAV